jgi:hypothetical protein
MPTTRPCHAIRERLTASDRSNTRWQYDLSVSYLRIGEVLIRQGNLLPDARVKTASQPIVIVSVASHELLSNLYSHLVTIEGLGGATLIQMSA